MSVEEIEILNILVRAWICLQEREQASRDDRELRHTWHLGAVEHEGERAAA